MYEVPCDKSSELQSFPKWISWCLRLYAKELSLSSSICLYLHLLCISSCHVAVVVLSRKEEGKCIHILFGVNFLMLKGNFVSNHPLFLVIHNENWRLLFLLNIFYYFLFMLSFPGSLKYSAATSITCKGVATCLCSSWYWQTILSFKEKILNFMFCQWEFLLRVPRSFQFRKSVLIQTIMYRYKQSSNIQNNWDTSKNSCQLIMVLIQ